jgi:hypothetical protein
VSLDPLSAALDLGNTLIQRIFPDPAQANAAKLELMKLQQTGELQQITGQLDINKTEAANPSMFVSGWRPSIGWICSSALAYQYLFRPIATWIAVWSGHTLPPIPGLDDNLWQLLLGMLGLGGLRTFEKINGVASK